MPELALLAYERGWVELVDESKHPSGSAMIPETE